MKETATLRVFAVSFVFMANAIINNASFLNSSGSPNKSNPFTVYSDESLNVGDIVSYNPYVRASSTNLSDYANNWKYAGYAGNIIFCIVGGNLITLRMRASSSLSTSIFNVSSIYESGVASSVKEHSSFEIVIAIDDTHLAAFSRAMYAGSEITYTQPRISILSLNQSTGTVSLIESYLLSSESNSIYAYYSSMIIVDGDIVMTGGPYGTRVFSTVYLSSDYTISGIYHSTFTSDEIIGAHFMVPDSAHRYLFLFSSANTNTYQRLVIPASRSKITVESKTFAQKYEISDAYMVDGKIILQSYPDYTHKIYSFDPSALTITMIHDITNRALINTRSRFSRLIDEHFYFVTTSDRGDETWTTLIDIETNQMIFTMALNDIMPSPVEPSLMQNRYCIHGYSSDKRVYVYDARRVIKYTINTGIPGAVVTSVISNGAYEVQSLS